MKLFLLSFLFCVLAHSNISSQCYFENDIEACFNGNLKVTSGLCAPTIFQMSSAAISPIPMCGLSGVLNNPSYYAFIADGTAPFSVVVTPIPGSCSLTTGYVGIQGALVGIDDCSSTVPLGDCITDCTSAPFSMTTYTTPDAGQIIIILLDGCNGSVCDVEFNITSGWTNNPIIPDTSLIYQSNIALESNLNCSNYTFTVEPEIEGFCNYLWTMPDGSNRTTKSNVLVVDMNGIPDGPVCVQAFSEDCFPGQYFPEENSICYSYIATEFTTIATGGEGTSCGLPNGSAYVKVEGEGPFSYLWSNGSADSLITDVEGGAYAVSIYDNFGCEYIHTVTVGTSQEVSIDILEILPSSSTENTGSISLYIIAGNEKSYELIGPEGFVLSNTIVVSTLNFINLAPGVYSLNVFDLNTGCSEIIQFEIQVITSINEIPLTKNSSIKIFPNPVNDILFVEGIDTEAFYSLYTITGELMLASELINNTIDVSNLTQGVYLIKISYANGESNVRKVVKM